MENENQITESFGGEIQLASPLEGTPWTTDDEIYEYASHRRYQLGWDWNDVKTDLVSRGLNGGYADAIIVNLMEAYGYGSASSPFEQNVIDNRGMFRRPFSFKGRIRRTEFGLSLLMYYAFIYGGAFFLGMLAGMTGSDVFIGLAYLLWIPGVWFLWAQGAKRCHDIGHSGWYMLIPFYIFWMLFAPGVPATTSYGTSPKAH